MIIIAFRYPCIYHVSHGVFVTFTTPYSDHASGYIRDITLKYRHVVMMASNFYHIVTHPDRDGPHGPRTQGLP